MTAARTRAVSVVAEAARAHRIECIGPGEVTCRACRERGWMSWSEFDAHAAEAVVAALEAEMGLREERILSPIPYLDRTPRIPSRYRLVTDWQEDEG